MSDANIQASGDFIDLHELAKGWKAAIARANDPATRHETLIKNDRGNLPLHSAASFRAPLELAECLLDAHPEAASNTNNYGNLALHFTAWKKGPLDVEKLLLKVYPEGAACKNNHGNLPLHYAAHYNAPLEVVEALYRAYPQGAQQKNNDNNTPLDLAIADGASPNVVALLQGKTVPPTDDEILEAAKSKCERMEKELQRSMEKHDTSNGDLEKVLALLMDIRDAHPHALYSAGMDPSACGELNLLLEQVRKAGAEEAARNLGEGTGDESSLSYGVRASIRDEEEEAQLIEEAICPPDDDVEVALSKIVGLEAVKNQVRGLRRTLELESSNRIVPRHMAFVGNPGVGKSTVARMLVPILYKIGAVKTPNFVEACRDDFVDKKSEVRTIMKTRKILEKASGGVLYIDEPYTMLPSTGRSRLRDHGAVALREIARSLPSGSPLVIMTGDSSELQKILSSDIGFKSHFLTRIEFPDPSPSQVARMFMAKLSQKGLVAGEGLTVGYLSELIENNTDEDWRMDRNGRMSDLLLHGVRAEMRKRLQTQDAVSGLSTSPMKLMSAAQRMPSFTPEEVLVTVEDVQNAIVNGM